LPCWARAARLESRGGWSRGRWRPSPRSWRLSGCRLADETCPLQPPRQAACGSEASGSLTAIDVERLPAIRSSANRNDRVSSQAASFVSCQGFEFFTHLLIRSRKDSDTIGSFGANLSDLLAIRCRVCLKDTDALAFISQRDPCAGRNAQHDGADDKYAGSYARHVHLSTVTSRLADRALSRVAQAANGR